MYVCLTMCGECTGVEQEKKFFFAYSTSCCFAYIQFGRKLAGGLKILIVSPFLFVRVVEYANVLRFLCTLY